MFDYLLRSYACSTFSASLVPSDFPCGFPETRAFVTAGRRSRCQRISHHVTWAPLPEEAWYHLQQSARWHDAACKANARPEIYGFPANRRTFTRSSYDFAGRKRATTRQIPFIYSDFLLHFVPFLIYLSFLSCDSLSTRFIYMNYTVDRGTRQAIKYIITQLLTHFL